MKHSDSSVKITRAFGIATFVAFGVVACRGASEAVSEETASESSALRTCREGDSLNSGALGCSYTASSADGTLVSKTVSQGSYGQYCDVVVTCHDVYGATPSAPGGQTAECPAPEYPASGDPASCPVKDLTFTVSKTRFPCANLRTQDDLDRICLYAPPPPLEIVYRFCCTPRTDAGTLDASTSDASTADVRTAPAL